MTGWTRRSRVDRLPSGRGEAQLDELWREARVIAVDASGEFTGRDGVPIPMRRPGCRTPADVLVGVVDGEPWFARIVEQVPPPAQSWRDVDLGSEQVVAAAVGLGRWHASAPPCEVCGAITAPAAGGASRGCVQCGAQAFPRQDPAVIVAVTDSSDRLLLARQSSWPTGRHSILAGFVEMGESAEQACVREVAEEVGVVIDNVRFHSSQPWPMPRSLMLGFWATTTDSTPVPDGVEISHAAFWSRDEVREATAEGSLGLPGRASIARTLVQEWLEGSAGAPCTD